MKNLGIFRHLAVAAALGIALLGGAALQAQDIGYDGTFTLSPVGDMVVALKLTLPMDRYQMLRNSVSNLYLLTRDLASNRAGVEVAEQKADWDDSGRTVIFNIRMLGAARNLGNRWEVEVAPEAVFSNLDEAKKIVYFNETASNQMGTIRGNSRLQLPAQATQAKYDASKKVVSYVMPKGGSGSSRAPLLGAAAVFLVLGLGAIGASFAVGRKPNARPPA
ncbi:MAG TPA: hypothetical protein PLP83_12250 [Candidatus Aminicenantes bacterium]|nr:hypothetical protein [Candidatus Aminicenantes bacterium]